MSTVTCQTFIRTANEFIIEVNKLKIYFCAENF